MIYWNVRGDNSRLPTYSKDANLLLINGFIEFGTIERTIPVDIIRPLVGFLAIIFSIKFLYAISLSKRILNTYG